MFDFHYSIYLYLSRIMVQLVPCFSTNICLVPYKADLLFGSIFPFRFTPEAKAGRHLFQYMPFGMGPRNCIAMRLALVELKVGLVHILRSYKVVTCDKTQVH